MKLLDKKRILADENLQKKQQIDEGVRLARKVDLLREELMSLESQHKSFLERSKSELDKTLGPLIERKAQLEKEIKQGETKILELRKPLDKEWSILHKEKEKIEEKINLLHSKEADLSKRNDEISVKEKKLKVRETNITALEEDTTKLNKDASDLKKEAKAINAKAKKEHSEQVANFDKENTLLASKQKQVEIDAKENARIKAIQDKKEKHLNDRERAINDKYQTLLRTIELTKHV